MRSRCNECNGLTEDPCFECDGKGYECGECYLPENMCFCESMPEPDFVAMLEELMHENNDGIHSTECSGHGDCMCPTCYEQNRPF